MKIVAVTGTPMASDGACSWPKKLAGVKPRTVSAAAMPWSPSDSSHR